MISRRNMVIAGIMAPVAACSLIPGGTTTVPLAQVQLYVSDLVNAFSAAGVAYWSASPAPSASNAALVKSIVDDLQTLNSAVQSVTDVTTAKSTILQILSGVNEISPLIMPFLGTAGVAVPLAVAVITAFVQSLPPPANAPATPPAALHKAALRYKGK
jgi:hypothetical protein